MNYKNLMIVAHPDDELIFGWKYLNQDTFVLCLTNEDKKDRKKAFYEVINNYNCDGIIFNFPDNGPSDFVWDYDIQDKISNIIKKYLNNNIEKIITHNPEGEYGHYHHKIVSNIVSKLVNNRLYYFSFNTENILTEQFYKNFDLYFSNHRNDPCVKAVLSLSKYSNIVHFNEFKTNKDFIYKTYNNENIPGFLNTYIITCKEYL